MTVFFFYNLSKDWKHQNSVVDQIQTTDLSKISAQSHTSLDSHFLDKGNNGENNRLPWDYGFVLQKYGAIRKCFLDLHCHTRKC